LFGLSLFVDFVDLLFTSFDFIVFVFVVSNVDTVTSLSNSSNQSIEQNVATDINTKTNILSKSPTNVINNNISVQSDRAQTTSTNSNLRQSQIIPNAISTEHQESTSELNGSVRKNKEEITMFNFMLVVEKKVSSFQF
jgi:hypothetical protein